jgi:hypothetical protein
LYRRLVFGVLSAICLPIGVGLWRRLRLAWYGLFVYIDIGSALFLLNALLSGVPMFFPIFGLTMPAAIGVGLYIAMKPAFVLRKNEP